MEVLVELQVLEKELAEMTHQYQAQVLQQLLQQEVAVVELVILDKDRD